MSTSDCICAHKTSVPEVWSYPEWKESEDNLALYQKEGYIVMRNLLTSEEVQATKDAVSGIIKKWFAKLKQDGNDTDYKDWEEVANRLPEMQGSETIIEDEMSIRRLFRMCIHDEYFAQLCCHPKIISMATELLGPDVKLLQSMAILKPPGCAQKKWHQDNAFHRITPSRLFGLWIALDPTDCSNGCMHVLPSSHGVGVYPHASSTGIHIDYSMVTLPNPDDVVPIILNPGDALVIHGEMVHYTPANVTNRRRRAIQFHYASCHCKPTKCPREEGESNTDPTLPHNPDKPHYFDCDPNCQEALYWYYKKGEVLVAGQDMDGDYI